MLLLSENGWYQKDALQPVWKLSDSAARRGKLSLTEDTISGQVPVTRDDEISG